MKPNAVRSLVHRLFLILGMAAVLDIESVRAHEAERLEFSPIGIPYAWLIELEANEVTATEPDHVGAWSWDEDGFPATAKGWTHTSAWVKLDLSEPVNLTLTLESLAGVPWPSAEEPARLAGTNLFPSFTLYRGWDTDAGVLTNADGTTLDQDHTYNNRGDIAWAEDVTYLDHVDNAVEHSITRTWTLPAGHYTVALGGNSPATVAEGRQGYRAVFGTTPPSAPVTNAALSSIAFSPVGIPYAMGITMDDQATVETPPDHVGAWSWDEDGFPDTARGWTHTSAWVKLRLTRPSLLTLDLSSRDGVSWPSAEEPFRLAGTNLFPSFTLYHGWDTDSGLITNLDGTTLDQDHTFNNRGNITWAEDVTYLNHLDNATAHEVSRTWLLAAGEYTINLGGNSPALVAEGRQGFRATFTTAPAPVTIANAALTPVEFNPVGIPYGWDLTLGADGTAQTLPDHVGAWSWDEDGFPSTARGWTHTSKWVKLNLTEPALLTLALESLDGVPWPSAEDAGRLAGSNLFPSFSIYSGWDTDAGLTVNPDGTTLDQDHTFNNRGNIAWAEDVTYLDHLDNGSVHRIARTWSLPAGHYTVNLGGNSPAVVAEGRQGYRATFGTRPAGELALQSHSGLEAVDAQGVSTWMGTMPFAMTGVLLNNPEEFLDATPGFLPFTPANTFALGGQWQVFFQSVDPADRGGTAAWMGQNYGNLPFIRDTEASYPDAEWQSEIARLSHDPATGRRFRKGDLIQVIARRTLDFAGKRNVNEAHERGAGADFEIHLVQSDFGLPAPEAVTLADLVRPDDGNPATSEALFDATRATGPERWQGQRVRIGNLVLTDPSGWGKTAFAERVCVVTDGAGRLFRLRMPLLDFGPPPVGAFDVVGIMDQDSGSGVDGTIGYELFVQEVLAVPSVLTVTLTPAGELKLSWPASAGEVSLVHGSSLGAAWVPVNGTPVLEGDRETMTLPLTEAAGYFRLQ